MKPNEEQTVELLETYLHKNSRQFTVSDAASVTGLPVLETEYGIKTLMQRYDCKLQVTDQGDLIYDFGKRLHRRYAKSIGERLRALGRSIWRGFVVVYKVGMSVLLTVYFIVFLVIIIGVMLAALGGGKDNKAGDAVGSVIYALLRGFLAIFEWSTIFGGSTYVAHNREGYPYRHYHEKPSAVEQAKRRKLTPYEQEAEFSNPQKGNSKGFAASTYDFVFGPPRVQISPLANRQEVASFLRQHKGVVSTAEIQALAGWTRDEAENFMTECLGYFDGRAVLSLNNTLYGDFSELVRSKDRSGEVPYVFYWDEYEPDYDLTGNSTGRNVGLIFMNIFNLVMSFVALGFVLFEWEMPTYSLAAILLGWFPLVYSVLFFLIPAVRAIFLPAQRRRQRMVNIRKRLYKAVFQSHTPRISLKRLTEIANEKRATEAVLDADTVHRVMMDCIHDLRGDSYLDPQTNEIMYNFEELDRELTDIEQVRKEKREDKDLGDIIMEA